LAGGDEEKFMTRRLFLLRHAKSSWDDPSLADFQRPLAKRGRRAIALLRDRFHALGFAPDLALVSSAARTRETFDALAPWRKPPRPEFHESLYHAAPEDMLALLARVDPAAEGVLLVGHNPGLGDLAIRLAGRDNGPLAKRLATKFPTGALAAYDIAGPWAEIGDGAGKLTDFILPRELEPAR
jgi:phosphohistidine phosphatase